jgi:hypothetical protein
MQSGCWHEPFHTSIKNGMEQKTYVIIYFDNRAIPTGHGYIEPGANVNLPQRIEEISHIEYKIRGHQCRLNQKQIAQFARAEVGGVVGITLHECNESKEP